MHNYIQIGRELATARFETREAHLYANELSHRMLGLQYA